ncbi:MAG TPA: DinB family protein [Candidatus Tectomicrobia bacterium]
MDILQAFLERHVALQGRQLSSIPDALTDDQIRSRPDAVVNSIAWLLWHVARGEDVYMNRLLSDRSQVLDAESSTS